MRSLSVILLMCSICFVKTRLHAGILQNALLSLEWYFCYPCLVIFVLIVNHNIWYGNEDYLFLFEIESACFSYAMFGSSKVLRKEK